MSEAILPDDSLARRLRSRLSTPGVINLDAIRQSHERYAAPGLGLAHSPLLTRVTARWGAGDTSAAAGELTHPRTQRAVADADPQGTASPDPAQMGGLE